METSYISGTIINPSTGQRLTYEEALETGVLDASKSTMLMPVSGKQIGLQDAIEQGIFNPKTGTLHDPCKWTLFIMLLVV